MDSNALVERVQILSPIEAEETFDRVIEGCILPSAALLTLLLLHNPKKCCKRGGQWRSGDEEGNDMRRV